MASQRPRARLTPSPLPKSAPAELIALRNASARAIDDWQELTREARKARHDAEQALDRYEDALLEYRGQLTLFEDGE